MNTDNKEPMDSLDDQLDKLLSPIFAYGVDWTEYKEKPETDHEVSTYAAKIKTEMKDSLKQAIKELFQTSEAEIRIKELNDIIQDGTLQGEWVSVQWLKKRRSDYRKALESGTADTKQP